MRTALKFLGVALAVFAVLAIGAYVYVSSFDVKALVAPVQARVKEVTGRDLEVRGGARIALSMHPRAVLTDVALGNAPWGAARDLLTAERLEVELALLPLLSKRFEIVEIALVAPVVALETSASGQHNWDLTRPGAAPGAVPGASGLPTAFGVANLVVSNGRLTFRDGATGGVTPVAIDRLALRAQSRSAPIAAEFRGTIDDIPVALEGTLGSLDALLAKRAPFPVDVKGEVAGQKTELVTSIALEGTRYQMRDLRINVGANALTGSFAVDTGGARPRIQFELSGPALALAALPLPAPRPAAATTPVAPGSAAAKGGAPQASGRFLFPDAPLNFSMLRMVDAAGGLAVARLTLSDGRAFEHLKLVFALDDGRLDVTSFSLALMGGTVAGSATIDARTAGAAAVTTQLTGTGLALGDILAAIGQKRDVRGGKTDVTAQLTMRGASLHGWASTATGNVRAVVGKATLANTKLDLDQALDRLAQAVNPFRESQPSTELECAVIRLPLANGIASIDRSIAMETKQLGLSATGTLDFRNETLDFTFRPQVRKGITVAIPNLADMVRLSGPFASPQVKVDAAGSAMAIASIGAAVGTVGLSALGQTLFAWAEGTGPGPCQVALGAAAGSAKPGAEAKGSGTPAVPIANDIGRAIGKLFGK